jgi:signal transduction histidine kinase
VRRRLSLRTRLLLGVVTLAAVGLIAADVATYTALRSFLLGRVDAALEAGHARVEQIAFPDAQGRSSGRGSTRSDDGDALVTPAAAGTDWYQVRTTAGHVVRSGFLVGGGSPPRLPSSIEVPAAGASRGERSTSFTVPSADGGTNFRIRASVDPQNPGSVLVIAGSLKGLDDTLNQLLLIEVIATLAALAAIVGVGLWVVRLGLRPLGAIGTTAAAIAAGDLSERVERADSRTEIGRLGASLNAMLAQIEAGVRATQASEEKLRRFVADASHELRTPLTAVRAYAELFGRGASSRPADLERSMAGITREAERMSLLVEDLLLLAHLDEGRPPERAWIALDEVVAEAVDAAHIVDPDRPISVDVEAAAVLGDRAQLRQVVDNLLANVRAHTPAASAVRVSLHQRGDRAVLSVADSGPGLDPGQSQDVFERFYRADASRARASGGVGLGLSIVAAVARAHGGEVSAHSGDDEGATFVVELPLLRDRAPDGESSGAAVS